MVSVSCPTCQALIGTLGFPAGQSMVTEAHIRAGIADMVELLSSLYPVVSSNWRASADERKAGVHWLTPSGLSCRVTIAGRKIAGSWHGYMRASAIESAAVEPVIIHEGAPSIETWQALKAAVIAYLAAH